MLCSFSWLLRSWEPNLWSTTNKCRKLYRVPDLFFEPTSSLAGCFLFNHFTSNSISSFPGFLFNLVLYYICLWIICNMFCLNKRSPQQNSNQDEQVECECHPAEKLSQGEFVYSLETKNKKLSEITHMDNNMFSLWLSRLQLQPNSKVGMDLHCQCKQLEIVETD